MTADSYALDAPTEGLEIPIPDRSRLMAAARGAGWVGLTGLAVTAATLVGMALSVIVGVGTLIVAAIALVCVVACAVVIAALLFVFAAVLTLGAALALSVAVGAAGLAGVCALLEGVSRGTVALYQRFGALRIRRTRMLHRASES